MGDRWCKNSEIRERDRQSKQNVTTAERDQGRKARDLTLTRDLGHELIRVDCSTCIMNMDEVNDSQPYTKQFK